MEILSNISHESLVLFFSSHVAGIQKGGVPFPLEVSDKILPIPSSRCFFLFHMGLDRIWVWALHSRIAQRKDWGECEKERSWQLKTLQHLVKPTPCSFTLLKCNSWNAYNISVLFFLMDCIWCQHLSFVIFQTSKTSFKNLTPQFII